MSKIFYEKIGSKYIPVYEYDHELLSALPYGNHLIMVHSEGSSRRYRVDPAFAPMIAAGIYHTNAIVDAILKAGRLIKPPEILSPRQQAAFDELADAMGNSSYMLDWASARDVADAGTKALQEEATGLLSNPSIKHAYDEFMLVCKLARESNDHN